MKDRIDLAIAVPPMFERAMWYDGNAQQVGFYWDCIFDDCVIVDGSSNRIASRGTWKAFCEHPKVLGTLSQFEFGGGASHAQHILILDRSKRHFYVMAHDRGEALLRELAPARQADSRTLAVKAPKLKIAGHQGENVLEKPLISKALADEIIHASAGLEKAMVAWLNAGAQPRSAWQS